jgi:hypothetical protein
MTYLQYFAYVWLTITLHPPSIKLHVLLHLDYFLMAR